MLSRATNSDDKYGKIVTLFTTLVLAMSGLVLSPANAIPDATPGQYVCTTGVLQLDGETAPTYEVIVDGVIIDGSDCVGDVVIVNGVGIIGSLAFSYAVGMTSITIPGTVETIVDGALSSTNITSITVDPANDYYSSSAGVLYNDDFTTLIVYPPKKIETSYSIPASVTSIDEWAFVDIFNLETVTFASGSQILAIGGRAFENAYSLISITIPEGVTSIGNMAFDGATSLTSISLPATLITIDDYDAFEDTALTSITIPANVSYIGETTFAGVPLASVYFLGNAPVVGVGPFDSVGAKAYIKSGATGFDLDTDGDGNPGVWYGLIVEIVEIVADSDADSSVPAPVIANGHRADKLGSVYFQPLSSDLSNAASKEIKKLVTANPAAIYKVIGYVQKSGSSKNNASLSLARAKAIEAYLVSLGAGVNFTVVLDAGLVPAKNGTSDKARKATLFTMTPVVQ